MMLHTTTQPVLWKRLIDLILLKHRVRKMKTIFIVNPAAGQGANVDEFVLSVNRLANENNAEVDVYLTKSVGDAADFVKNYCRKNGKARFIACGGDGTLSEVINGAVGFEDAEIGVMPRGTGNDFCRNFDGASDFNCISDQIAGETVSCDVIKYISQKGNDTKEGYCVNMSNIGFDCSVASLASELKNKPFVSGSFAYFLSILINLIKKKGENLKIEIDGKVIHRGRMLMLSIANGCYCGGGIKSNPLADLHSGMINTNVVKNVSRTRFIHLLPYYMKGTFLKVANIERYISSVNCKEITVTPKSGTVRVCVDGEIIDAGNISFKVINNAFRFVLPKKNNIAESYPEKTLLFGG